jgi:hypothetical protein
MFPVIIASNTPNPRPRNRHTHIANSGWEKGLGQLLHMSFSLFFSAQIIV